MKVHINNEPELFHNEDFQTIQIKVIFPFKRCEDELALMHILPGLLHTVSSKYPTEEEFTMVGHRLFVLANFCTCNVMGDVSYFCFNFMVPDDKYLDDGILEEQMAFFHEMIYNPKVIDNAFYPDEVAREVKNLVVDIEKVLKDNVSYALIQAKNIVDDDGLFSSNIYNHRDQIDLVTGDALYKYYLKTIYNNKPLVYVFGNIRDTNISELCKKYLYRESYDKYDSSINIKNYMPVRNIISDTSYDSTFKNSVLIEFYKIKDMSLDDEVLVGTCKELLSSLSSRILNKKLRDEAEAVYSSYAVNYNNYGLFGIIALIEKDKVNIVREKIDEAINTLKDVDYITPLLDNIKERHRVNLIRRLDDKTLLFQDEIVKSLEIDISPQEYYEKLCSISAEDISLFINRLVLDTVYFLKEGENE